MQKYVTFCVIVAAATYKDTGKSRNNMVIPKLRTSMGQRGIAYRGPFFWNSLPHDLKVVDVFKQFKRMISGMVW